VKPCRKFFPQTGPISPGLHIRLSNLSRDAHQAAEGVQFGSQRNRQRYLDAIGNPVAEIDAQVQQLLG
jgi:hypothetical protein